MKNQLFLSLKGFAMGIAETIPGVSGGTIAFITGIYERLIDSIKNVLNPNIFSILSKEGISGVWKHIDGNFLLFLIAGMLVGLVGGVFGVTTLIEEYPPIIWAFFFGLIIASAIYIARQIDHWSPTVIAFLLLGIVIAFSITVLNPLQGSNSLLAFFFSGAIAISALILPGISGSFILLLLGMYTSVTTAVRGLLSSFSTDQLWVVLAFALGCLAGLASFSRLLSWTFKRYTNPTLAILTGFMIGSLNKLWPWQNVTAWRESSSGHQEPLTTVNVWPQTYEGESWLLASILALLVGFAIVFLLDNWGKSEPIQATQSN